MGALDLGTTGCAHADREKQNEIRRRFASRSAALFWVLLKRIAVYLSICSRVTYSTSLTQINSVKIT